MFLTVTYPWVVEEWRDHEPNENDAEAVQQNEKEHRKIIRVLKNAEWEKQNDRHKW